MNALERKKALGFENQLSSVRMARVAKRIPMLNFTRPLQKYISSSTSHPVHHTDILPCFPHASPHLPSFRNPTNTPLVSKETGSSN